MGFTAQTIHYTPSQHQRLVNRLHRIEGPVAAVEDLLNGDVDCERTLHTLIACRGAINSLIAEILEDHVLSQVVGPDASRSTGEWRAAEQLLDIIRTYLR